MLWTTIVTAKRPKTEMSFWCVNERFCLSHFDTQFVGKRNIDVININCTYCFPGVFTKIHIAHENQKNFSVLQLGPRRIHTVRTRGGNKKYRALRLDTGNFSWGSEGNALTINSEIVLY